MVKSKLTFILSIGLLFLFACGGGKKKDTRTSFKDADAYNEYMNSIVNELHKDWDLMMAQKELKLCLKYCDTLKVHSQKGIDKLNSLQPFNTDSTYRDAVKEYVEHLNKLSKSELPECLDIIMTKKFLTDEGQTRKEELLIPIDTKREELYNKAVQKQVEFARNNNLVLD